LANLVLLVVVPNGIGSNRILAIQLLYRLYETVTMPF